jgi:hypothetical protein
MRIAAAAWSWLLHLVGILALIVLVAACSDAAGGEDGGSHDAAIDDAASDDGASADGATDAGEMDAGETDAGDTNVDAGPCSCPDDQPVEIFHPCSPPLRVGCIARTCTAGGDECEQGESCLECSAAACCTCSSCVAACMLTGPAMGPLPEYLKLQSSHGPAGQQHEIVVQGYPFYIGALFYLARVGDSGDLMESSYPDTCARAFIAPAHGPGMVPVWVSQYGGAEPWVLSGFYSYTPDTPPACVQPGFPCQAADPCCQTADVPMACTGGRCLME